MVTHPGKHMQGTVAQHLDLMAPLQTCLLGLCLTSCQHTLDPGTPMCSITCECNDTLQQSDKAAAQQESFQEASCMHLKCFTAHTAVVLGQHGHVF